MEANWTNFTRFDVIQFLLNERQRNVKDREVLSKAEEIFLALYGRTEENCSIKAPSILQWEMETSIHARTRHLMQFTDALTYGICDFIVVHST